MRERISRSGLVLPSWSRHIFSNTKLLTLDLFLLSLGSVCKLSEGEAFVRKIQLLAINLGTNASPLQSNFGLCRHALVIKGIP